MQKGWKRQNDKVIRGFIRTMKESSDETRRNPTTRPKKYSIFVSTMRLT